MSTDELEGKLGPDVAAIMLTNPNTCGLFERDIREIADAVHEAGAYFYCDGANFNAIAGRVRPGDLGIDAMHINLHKTFSTPHGGGGPGAGPVVLSAALAPFAPLPLLVHDAKGFRLIEDRDELPAGAKPFGRMCAFHGQMGMFVRALAYMLSHGRDGVRQASEDAVLSANYILASLKDVMSAPFGDGPCMHEALFDDQLPRRHRRHHARLRQGDDRRGLSPDDHVLPAGRARRDADRADEVGIRRSRSTASSMCCANWRWRRTAKNTTRFDGAPRFAPRRRLDETAAARKPVLRWKRRTCRRRRSRSSCRFGSRSKERPRPVHPRAGAEGMSQEAKPQRSAATRRDAGTFSCTCAPSGRRAPWCRRRRRPDRAVSGSGPSHAVRSVPLSDVIVITAPVRSAPSRSACARFAPDRSVPRNVAFEKFAKDMHISTALAPSKFAPARFFALTQVLVRSAPCRLQPGQSTMPAWMRATAACVIGRRRQGHRNGHRQSADRKSQELGHVLVPNRPPFHAIPVPVRYAP